MPDIIIFTFPFIHLLNKTELREDNFRVVVYIEIKSICAVEAGLTTYIKLNFSCSLGPMCHLDRYTTKALITRAPKT